jgi:hypothetical protein
MFSALIQYLFPYHFTTIHPLLIHSSSSLSHFSPRYESSPICYFYAILTYFLRKLLPSCTNIAIQEQTQWLQFPKRVVITQQMLQLLCPSIYLLQFQTQLSLLLSQLQDFSSAILSVTTIGQTSLLTQESEGRKVDN